MNWEAYRGKKIMVLIRGSKFPYTGEVVDIFEENGVTFIKILDIKDCLLTFSPQDLVFIREDGSR
jgi:hypothetical protein